jgi:osmotically-inducible protein OsmY
MTDLLSNRIKLLGLATLIGASSLLSACAPILVGGAAAGTVLVATDRRTVGQQVTDKEIDLKVSNEMSVRFGQTARIKASAYDGVVLLVGDAFSEKIRGEAAAAASEVSQVKSVINRLDVGPLASFSQITSDTWLSSKVRTTLIATRDVPSGAVITTIEKGNVYLQGLVTQAEADKIAEVVAGVSGVKKVYTLFDIMTPEQAAAFAASREPRTGLPPSNPSPTGASSSAAPASGAEVPMPEAGAPSTAPVQAPSAPAARPLM